MGGQIMLTPDVLGYGWTPSSACAWSCAKCQFKKKVQRRLVQKPVAAPWQTSQNVTRTAAIPLADVPNVANPQLAEPDSEHAGLYGKLGLGALATGLVCAGCFLNQCYQRFKKKVRRDTFGFKPNSQRTSLTVAERMV